MSIPASYTLPKEVIQIIFQYVVGGEVWPSRSCRAKQHRSEIFWWNSPDVDEFNTKRHHINLKLADAGSARQNGGKWTLLRCCERTIFLEPHDLFIWKNCRRHTMCTEMRAHFFRSNNRSMNVYYYVHMNIMKRLTRMHQHGEVRLISGIEDPHYDAVILSDALMYEQQWL